MAAIHITQNSRWCNIQQRFLYCLVCLMVFDGVQQANFSITEADMEAGQVEVFMELSARYGLPSGNHTITSRRNATVRLQVQRSMQVDMMLENPSQSWIDTAGAGSLDGSDRRGCCWHGGSSYRSDMCHVCAQMMVYGPQTEDWLSCAQGVTQKQHASVLSV